MTRQLQSKGFRIPVQICLLFVQEVTVFAECSLGLSGASLGESDVRSSNEQGWTFASALEVIIEQVDSSAPCPFVEFTGVAGNVR
jgi:hypothetical protein